MPSLPSGMDQAIAGGEMSPDDAESETDTARQTGFQNMESGKAKKTENMRTGTNRIINQPITSKVASKLEVPNLQDARIGSKEGTGTTKRNTAESAEKANQPEAFNQVDAAPYVDTLGTGPAEQGRRTKSTAFGFFLNANSSSVRPTNLTNGNPAAR